MNPALGEITCPHCGNDKATVHKEKKGKIQALYYKCPNCGTIQCRYSGGQKFINEKARWYTPDNQDAREAAAVTAAAEAKGEVAEFAHKKAAEKPVEIQQQAKQKTGGFMSLIATALDKEIL